MDVKYRLKCRDGGIGRRDGLKIRFSQGSGGSIPPLGRSHPQSSLHLLIMKIIRLMNTLPQHEEGEMASSTRYDAAKITGRSPEGIEFQISCHIEPANHYVEIGITQPSIDAEVSVLDGRYHPSDGDILTYAVQRQNNVKERLEQGLTLDQIVEIYTQEFREKLNK